jgi:hypothetical protein
MDKAALESLLYLLLLFAPLLYLPRFLQREIQSIFLLITRQPEISLVLFSLMFLPGVLIHELSHFIMAHLLGVKTGRFSLIPKKLANGHLQLGYVETASTDFVRDALIGAAPLIAGSMFIGFIGVSRLEFNVLWQSLVKWEVDSFWMAVRTLIDQPDFWLWFYLVFTISSTMMPSSSDRRAWLPLTLVIGVFSGLILLFGAGPWIFSHLGTVIKSAIDAITIVFGITVFIHLLLFPPAWLIRKLLSHILGYQVV